MAILSGVLLPNGLGLSGQTLRSPLGLSDPTWPHLLHWTSPLACHIRRESCANLRDAPILPSQTRSANVFSLHLCLLILVLSLSLDRRNGAPGGRESRAVTGGPPPSPTSGVGENQSVPSSWCWASSGATGSVAPPSSGCVLGWGGWAGLCCRRRGSAGKAGRENLLRIAHSRMKDRPTAVPSATFQI